MLTRGPLREKRKEKRGMERRREEERKGEGRRKRIEVTM